MDQHFPGNITVFLDLYVLWLVQIVGVALEDDVSFKTWEIMIALGYTLFESYVFARLHLKFNTKVFRDVSATTLFKRVSVGILHFSQ